ncbi:MAG: hypothetical protein WAV09_04205 [Minisyncoccia bacterium]
MTQKLEHVCGLCGADFATEAEYVAYTCEVTGVTPADIEHQGPEFAAISDAALERGAKRKEAGE